MPTFRRLINHGFDRQDRTSGLLGMKISKEARIGLIVTVGIAALFWGINYLKGKDFFTSQKLVYAVYDHVDGLQHRSGEWDESWHGKKPFAFP